MTYHKHRFPFLAFSATGFYHPFFFVVKGAKNFCLRAAWREGRAKEDNKKKRRSIRAAGETKATDYWVLSQDPESVPFVRRVLQTSQTDERWSTLAGHVAVIDQCAYSNLFTRVRQVISAFW